MPEAETEPAARGGAARARRAAGRAATGKGSAISYGEGSRGSYREGEEGSYREEDEGYGNYDARGAESRASAGLRDEGRGGAARLQDNRRNDEYGQDLEEQKEFKKMPLLKTIIECSYLICSVHHNCLKCLLFYFI